MLRRLGWFVGLNQKGGLLKKSVDAKPHQTKINPVLMFDTVQEIGIYIHRFHNLDLFQQGWYQIKITLRWEDGEHTTVATPSRVVQYEASGSADDTYGIWRINDQENSFCTQPFRIKYARQDVRLSMMISFSLPLGMCEGQLVSAVILKFELLYAPITEKMLFGTLDISSVSVHEFRIPPKALMGLHSYCPVYFDTLHAVLVDVSIHISMLKSAYYTKAENIHSNAVTIEDVIGGIGSSHAGSANRKSVLFVKALLDARDILLEDLQRLSKGVNKPIDFSEFTSIMNEIKLSDSAVPERALFGAESLGQGKQQNNLEKLNGSLDFLSNDLLFNLSNKDLSVLFDFLGSQVRYLWNTFLTFHRDNKVKILEFLRDGWEKDRGAEWAIWMVYSKVEMPHHYLNNIPDESSNNVHKRVSSLWKFHDPAQTASAKAELHRQSIAQMRMNNRAVQDLQIFRDPMRVPIVIIERVLNAPRRTFSANSYMRQIEMPDSRLNNANTHEIARMQSGNDAQHSGRDLKVVVFVHGFQGHHLDLRLVRNQWLLIDPKIEFLMSEANEEKTHGDFREMGQRLAQEVVSYVKKKMDKYFRSGRLRNVRLSFVGHSIGNIIIRTAIADSIMEPYRRYLCTYISLSGPHLGYLYSSNALFNSGLWLLKKLKNTQCIHQLTLTDDPDLQNTFFYQLCKQKTLENFKHIILLSSPQDGYVPYHSARIETCQAASMDSSKRAKAFLEMLNNCLDQIRPPNPDSPHRVFMRCDVNFDTATYGKNLNSFIGRAAHIEFLESDVFARLIMWSFREIFH